MNNMGFMICQTLTHRRDLSRDSASPEQASGIKKLGLIGRVMVGKIGGAKTLSIISARSLAQ